MAVKKAKSYKDAKKKNYTLLHLKDKEFSRHLGVMERKGSVAVCGDSGHGKTTYMLKSVKALCDIEKVHICTPEEDDRYSWLRSLELNNMQQYERKFSYSGDHYDELFERLSRKRQKKIIIIDSLQVFFKGKKRDDYYKLIHAFPDTLFIFIIKTNKKGELIGAVADEVYWDCQNRIIVKDFKAYVEKSRCGGDETQPLIINQQKAEERAFKLLKKG